MDKNKVKLNQYIDAYNVKYNILDEDVPQFDCLITDDMVGAFRKFAETEEQLREQSEIMNLNGTVIFTKDNRSYLIVVNKNQFNEGNDYIHTIFHEYTHVLDYHSYMKANCICNFDKLIESKYIDAFYLWTEYHARYIGTENYYNHQLNSNQIFDEDMRQFITEQTEAKFEQLNKELQEFLENKQNPKLMTHNNFLNVMYNVTQHFARFSAFKKYGVNALDNASFPISYLEHSLSIDILEYNKLLESSNNCNKLFELKKLSLLIDKIYKYTCIY